MNFDPLSYGVIKTIISLGTLPASAIENSCSNARNPKVRSSNLVDKIDNPFFFSFDTNLHHGNLLRYMVHRLLAEKALLFTLLEPHFHLLLDILDNDRALNLEPRANETD